jgi:hypothetical protein
MGGFDTIRSNSTLFNAEAASQQRIMIFLSDLLDEYIKDPK